MIKNIFKNNKSMVVKTLIILLKIKYIQEKIKAITFNII